MFLTQHLRSPEMRLSNVLFALPILIAVASRPNLAEAEASDLAMQWFDQNASSFVSLYKKLHQNPEVSFFESETAATLAETWSQAGYDVTTDVGGHGLVGILHNGDGPTLMLRCDLDGLPVSEQTGLPYASTKQVTTASGESTFTMHACGHDIHMTNLTAVAKFMSAHRDQWSGTLMIIGQPAEERGAGALAMLEDGLFTRFEKPDAAVAIHVAADLPAGTIGYRAGYSQANVDSVDITMRGRGGHGSKPEMTVDPIMQAAELVTSLQTIVSREIKPTDPAVVTVGSIHGGTKHNIIGDSCHLQLTVRSYDSGVRSHLLDAIERKANAVAMGCPAPETHGCIYEGTPTVFN
ncbi:MAG: amidohydrolase, partial [Planctomycetota bacterium]